MMPRTVIAGLAYFAMVFGAGALLGTLRVLWIAPALGARVAELAEIPLMLALAALAARWIVRRLALGFGERLGAGILALALVLACEFTVVLAARGLTLARYFETFDPVSGTAYYVALLVFMVLPLWFEPREEVPA
ncbi:MAG TPA: hypothetical protein VG873_15905 [Burkholderiales bacterium]|nr:hypothetical protein [Burkholderiales bacterium]